MFKVFLTAMINRGRREPLGDISGPGYPCPDMSPNGSLIPRPVFSSPLAVIYYA